MSTAVATTQPVDLQARALAVFAGGVNPFTAASKAEGVSDGVYGRFNGNTGDFLLGEETAEPGAPVVFEFLTAKQEWLGFDAQNKPVRGPSVSFLSGQPLPDHDNTPGVRWVKQIVVSIVTMDGKRVVYSAKAERPTRAIWRLLNTFGQKMPMMVDDQGRFKMPVVELHARSFSMNVDEPIRLPNGMFDIDPATNQPKMQKVPVTKYSEDYRLVDWYSEDEIEDLIAGAGPAADESDVEEATYKVIDATPASQAAAVAPATTGARRPRPGQRA